jgi:hypothetical protein
MKSSLPPLHVISSEESQIKMNAYLESMIKAITSNDFGSKSDEASQYLSFLETLSNLERIDDTEDITNHNRTEMGMGESKTSTWSNDINYIQNRPKGWLGRYLKSIEGIERDDEENIVEDNKWSSRWNKVTLPPKPQKPNLYNVNKFVPVKDPTSKSNFCLKCWELVLFGPMRVCCQHCTVTAHRYCIPDIENYYVDNDEDDNNGDDEFGNSISESSSGENMLHSSFLINNHSCGSSKSDANRGSQKNITKTAESKSSSSITGRQQRKLPKVKVNNASNNMEALSSAEALAHMKQRMKSDMSSNTRGKSGNAIKRSLSREMSRKSFVIPKSTL